MFRKSKLVQNAYEEGPGIGRDEDRFLEIESMDAETNMMCRPISHA